VASIYHAWRGQQGAGTYEDVPGFSRAGTTAEIEASSFALTPGRYVGVARATADDGAIDEEIGHVVSQLREDFVESERMTAEVRAALRAVGYEL
jgi:type I restriction enzyme M protein